MKRSIIVLCMALMLILCGVAVANAEVGYSGSGHPDPGHLSPYAPADQPPPPGPWPPCPVYPGTKPIYPGACPGVYDRGPLPHARGNVQGDKYFVHFGDTLFSIGQRFCVPVSTLQSCNNIHGFLLAKTWIVIPGLGPTPFPPCVVTSPLPNTTLQSPFGVNGTCPPGATIQVRAENNNGQLLAEQTTVAQASGAWSVQMTVNVACGTQGRIRVTSGNLPPVTVPVIFGGIDCGCTSTSTITTPAPGTRLQGAFPVSGIGPSGQTIQVRAENNNGQLLAPEQTTVAQAGGAWSVQMAVNVASETQGRIRVTSSGCPQPVTVPVTFVSVIPPICTITTPAPGTRLQGTFGVSGIGPSAQTIQVRAENNNGQLLAPEQTTMAQAGGAWSVQMAVNVASETQGRIRVTSSGCPQPVTVPVTFGSVLPPICTITMPAPWTRLQGTFTVSGIGPSAQTIQVRAENNNEQLLAPEQTTMAQASGAWSVQMTVIVASETQGRIRVTSGCPQPLNVPVTFGGQPFPTATPNPCTITPNNNAPYYREPNNLVLLGYFQGVQPWPAVARQMDNSGLYSWYNVYPGPNGFSVWVPSYAVNPNTISPGCQF